MTKAELKNLRRLREELDRQRERLARAESRLFSPCSVRPEGAMSNSRRKGKPDAIGTGLENAEKYRNMLAASVNSLDAEVCRIEAAISAVGDARLREVLRRRYIDGQSWAVIEREMHYSPRQVQRDHERALKSLGRK